jgi:excisionase family DNA binding protein
MSESVSMNEAARYLGASRSKIRRLVKDGPLTTRRSLLDRGRS